MFGTTLGTKHSMSQKAAGSQISAALIGPVEFSGYKATRQLQLHEMESRIQLLGGYRQLL